MWHWLRFAQSWTRNGTCAVVKGRLALSSQEMASAETFGHELSPTLTALIKKGNLLGDLLEASRGRVGRGWVQDLPRQTRRPSPGPPPPSPPKTSVKSAEFSCSTSQPAAGPGLSRAPSSLMVSAERGSRHRKLPRDAPKLEGAGVRVLPARELSVGVGHVSAPSRRWRQPPSNQGQRLGGNGTQGSP